MKLVGLGFKNYARDNFNLFDALIVVVSLVDFSIAASGVSGDSEDGGIFSAFRALRLLRVIKLARKWGEFRRILHQLIMSIKSIWNFTILLFVIMFIFALLGMEMFAYKLAYDSDGNEIMGMENI